MTDGGILRALRMFYRPGDVFEIRVLDAERPGYRRPHIESGYFDYDHIDDVPQTLAETSYQFADAMLALAHKENKEKKNQ